MKFRDPVHEQLARKIIENWYLPQYSDDGEPMERKLQYAQKVSSKLTSTKFPVKGFLSENPNTPLDVNLLLDWFAILDHLSFYSKFYSGQDSDYFDTFWPSLHNFYDFYVSIRSTSGEKDLKPILESTFQSIPCFIPGSERYFKCLMILLGHRDSVVEIEKNKRLGMSALIDRFNPQFGGSAYLDIYKTVVYYRNPYVHGDSREVIPDNEKLSIPHIDNGYNISNNNSNKNANALVDIIRLFVACFLRIVMLHQKEMEEELAKQIINDGLTHTSSISEPVDVEPILARYAEDRKNEALRGFKKEAEKIGGQSGELIQIGVTQVFSEWQDSPQGPDSHISVDALPCYKNNGVAFLLGSPGAGKSTLLKQIMLVYVSQWEDSSKSFLPIHISLEGEGGTKDNLDVDLFCRRKGFLDKLSSYNSTELSAVNRLYDDLANEGRLVLLLDGLNELKPGSEGFMKSLATLIAGKFRKCRVFITDRLYEFQDHQTIIQKIIINNVDVFQIDTISGEVIMKYLKDLSIPEQDILRFQPLIENESLGALMSVPLNFMMLMQVVKSTAGIGFTKETGIKTRGELLETFMRAVIKETKDASKMPFVDVNIFDPLQDLAVLLFETGGERIAKSRLRKEIPSEFVAKNILCVWDGDDPEYSFVYDTYREFFLGRFFARLALRTEDDSRQRLEQRWLTPTLLHNPRHDERYVEALKLALEIMLLQKDHGADAAEWLVKTIYGKDHHTGTTIPSGSLYPPANRKVNGALKLLCTIVRDLPVGSKPFVRVFEWTMNEMMLFRLNYPMPTTDLVKSQKNRLREAISCASILNTDKVNTELFSIYWLALMGIVNRSEFGFRYGNAVSKSALLESVFNDARHMFDSLFRLHENLRITGLNESQGLVHKFILLLFNKFKGNPYAEELLYNHIEKLRLHEPNVGKELLLFSSSLAFYFGDIRTLPDRAHLGLLAEKGKRLGWQQLNALLRADEHYSERMELALSEPFRKVLAYEQEMIGFALTVFLNRSHGELPAPVQHFLFSDNDKAIVSLGEKRYKAVLDMIPLSQIPPRIRDGIYNPSISTYLLEHPHHPVQSSRSVPPNVYDCRRGLEDSRFVSLCMTEKEQLTYYQLYTRSSTRAVLITRKVMETTPCWIKLGKKIYPVQAIEDIHDVVELEFETAVPAHLPNSGFITSDAGERIPYLHVSQNQRRHCIQLDKCEFEARCLDSTESSLVTAQGYHFARYRLQLRGIRKLPTSNLYSLWTLAISGQDYIRQSGCFQMDSDAEFKCPRPAKITPRNRFDDSLENVSIVAAQDGVVFLVSSGNSPAYVPGNWIRLDPSSRYLPILTPARKVPWAMELSFFCVRALPSSGSFSIPDTAATLIYRSKFDDGRGNNVWEVFPVDDTLSFRGFFQDWAAAKSMIVKSSSSRDEAVFNIHSKGHSARLEGTIHMISLRFSAWNDQWPFANPVDLAAPHPCSTPFLEESLDDSRIALHQVFYQSTPKRGEIKIVAPETFDKNMRFSLDGGPRCRMGIPESREEGNITYLFIQVRMDDGRIPRIGSFGQMQLFYPDTGEPASLEYDMLLKCIALALPNPDLIHASICPRLIKELLSIRLLSSEILSFFEEKSAVHLLLEHKELADQVLDVGDKKHRLNICWIHDPEPGHVFSVYSPKMGRTLTPVPPSVNVSGHYVLCEKDNRSYPIPMISRKPIFGFLDGIIITRTRKKDDAFVHVASESRDYYIPKCHLEVGTLVSFFPGINDHYSNNSLNRFGEQINYMIARDIEVTGEMPWEDAEIVRIRRSTDKKGTAWIELTVKGCTGNVEGKSGIMSFPKGTISEAKSEELQIGKHIKVIKYFQRWIHTF